MGKIGDENKLPEIFYNALYNGHEEPYLEYKGDVDWSNRGKMLEIIKTIFAISNEKDGGIIVIGVHDDGRRLGLSDENYNSYSHDTINQTIDNRGNQPLECKVDKVEHKDKDDGNLKKFVFIQVTECKELPLVYTGAQELENKQAPAMNSNIALREGALYIRNKRQNGNKEIQTTDEWQELIERTYKKYQRETKRRASIIEGNQANPFDEELNL